MQKARIFVALPLGKNRYKEPELEWSIDQQLFTPNDTFEVLPEHYEPRRGSPNIYMQRYNLAMKFLDTDCTHYLYLDSDQMIYEPDDAIEILVKCDVDIISPIIVRTFFPHLPACMSFDRKRGFEKGKQVLDDFRNLKKYPDDLIEVYYSCGGLCLIKREVLEKVDRPFMPVEDENGIIKGTDISLYYKARQLGFKCYVHRGIVCGHVGRYVYTPDNYYQILDTGQLKIKKRDGTNVWELER